MFKKAIRPCFKKIEFFKKGCPKQHDSQSQNGCPAWRKYTIPSEEKGKPPVTVEDCAFVLQERWQFESLRLLEGIQKAIESFRNGLCTTGPDGKTYPKADPMLMTFISMLGDQSRLNAPHIPVKELGPVCGEEE